MLVKAAPGIRVPREGNPRTYITDDATVEIDMTAYYIRRMSDGDLVEVAAPAAAAETPPADTLVLLDAPDASQTTGNDAPAAAGKSARKA